MARTPARCQFDSDKSRHQNFDHNFRVLVNGLLALAIAISTVITASAQQPSKPEAEATALARRTIAAQLSLPIEQIQVLGVSKAEWRDSSLGCPERGLRYTPVMTSGYKVRLRDAEREHVVHVAGGRAVICSSQADPKLSSAPLISASLKAADAVRTVLGGRLKIEPARVRIVSTRPVRSDARPCAAAPSERSGDAFIVEAAVEARTFRYYTDAAKTVSCDDPVQKPR